ncbi:hypothetical protein [Wolbachia endosymbiont (group A) of Chalcis sispes]|uniref:hypothetical protein n=1 Tax=Wolbachia endosymbiont (group A) of Chalcis sispes TaxID=3066197 RepID=UPI003132C381
MFAEMFGVELAAAVEASTEKEDKKAEKTSLKEENKEVCENVEIKLDEREKPKVPVFLFEISPGFVRPVVLSKPELDLLPKPIMPSIFKEVINNENREETKPKVEEEKKAKPEGPKKEVCPPAPKTATNTTEQGRKKVYGCNSDWRKMIEQDNNNTYQASSQSAQSFVSDKKASNQSAKSPVPDPRQPDKASGSTPGKSASNIEAKKQPVERLDFTVGFWNGPENESSVNNAQPPKELTNDVKVEKCAEGQSVGKTP